MEFQSSVPFSLGVELELQLVRPHDLDLAHDAGDLLVRLARRTVPGQVKPEVTLSMIELNSSVHSEFAPLAGELAAQRDAVMKAARELNLGVCGGGAHPFHDWAERRVYPDARFERVMARYGYLAKQFTVFGQHIHVGCPDGDAAVRLTHLLARYVPHFIALAAASPFYQGQDTSFQSSRLTAVSAFPLAGHLPWVPDWSAFMAYFERMRGMGIVQSMKDFYWDIRPKPEYGTVEIRVCDTPLTVGRAAQLAAYAQALSAMLLERGPVPVPELYEVNSFNRFEACRFGLRGSLVDPYSRTRRAIDEDLLESLSAVLPWAQARGAGEALRDLTEDVRAGATEADWLRRQRSAQGDLGGAVREACRRWARA